jgi:hypothetical protein
VRQSSSRIVIPLRCHGAPFGLPRRFSRYIQVIGGRPTTKARGKGFCVFRASQPGGAPAAAAQTLYRKILATVPTLCEVAHTWLGNTQPSPKAIPNSPRLKPTLPKLRWMTREVL